MWQTIIYIWRMFRTSYVQRILVLAIPHKSLCVLALLFLKTTGSTTPLPPNKPQLKSKGEWEKLGGLFSI